MTTLELFARRGPDDSVLPTTPCEASCDYVRGREDYLFGRTFSPPAAPFERRNAYVCGWGHERLDCEAAAGKRPA